MIKSNYKNKLEFTFKELHKREETLMIPYKTFKRFLDIIVSALGIFLLSPLIIITAIMIKIESPGPVLFKQERLGVEGKVFRIYKFRSMCLDAEKGGVYEKEGDKRVTRVGKLIRKTSIDEIPQLINILKGQMSLIGPRPPLTYHPWKYEEYTQEQKKMFLVKPGVSGWAQIKGRKSVEWEKRIKLNIEYVDKISFLLDLKILLITIVKVVKMQDNLNIEETRVENQKVSRDSLTKEN